MTATELVRAPETPRAAPWVLTALDRANLQYVLRGTWIFESRLDAARLTASLSQVLAHLPHLAGRLGRDGAIALSNQGVPFTVAARPDLTVAWACDHPDQADLFSAPLPPSQVRRGRAAPLNVTLTELRDGTVLGVRCTHACLDGRGFYTLVSHWSRICRGEPSPTPLLDQSLVPRAPRRPKAEVVRDAEASGWVKLSLATLAWFAPSYLLGRMHQRAPAVRFSDATLRHLRQAAAPGAGASDLPSTNVALSAHLTRMCTKLHGVPEGTPCSQVTILDARQRLSSVPLAFAGNAAYPAVTARFAAGAPLLALAAQIQQRLAPYVAVPSPELLRQFLLAQEVMDHKILMVPFDVAAVHQRHPTVIHINNISKLPIYDVDFGDAAGPAPPVRVIPHNLPDPVLIWPAPPRTGGVEVYFTGVTARAALRRPATDPFWRELGLVDGADPDHGEATSRGARSPRGT